MTPAETTPYVLVVMPFHARWRDFYELGIKPACEAVGARCEHGLGTAVILSTETADDIPGIGLVER